MSDPARRLRVTALLRRFLFALGDAQL